DAGGAGGGAGGLRRRGPAGDARSLLPRPGGDADPRVPRARGRGRRRGDGRGRGSRAGGGVGGGGRGGGRGGGAGGRRGGAAGAGAAAAAAGRKLTFSEQHEWERIEGRITEAEAKLAALEAECARPDVVADAARLVELDAAMAVVRGDVDRLYARWAELEGK